MTVPSDDTTTDLHAMIAELRAERDAALSEKAALAEALARRNTEFGERIEQQSATIDVLKVMSAAPGDPQPVFDLIVHRARDLCNAAAAILFEFDGRLVHFRARSGYDMDQTVQAEYQNRWPAVPTRDSITCRSILDKEIIHVRDLDTEADLLPVVRRMGHKSQVSIPLLREGSALGDITLAAMEPGGFSDSQITLLQTFAEQAVIAITSAETYRALQTRTSDLQETLEYQTATSDVLKVISRSAFDLQPVLDTVAQTSARLCDADRAAIFRREGDFWRLAVNFGFPPAWQDYIKTQSPFSLDRFAEHAAVRAVVERRPVHIDDLASVPGYENRLGEQRTTLGVPLLRDGEAIGTIVLARLRVEPFTDGQIELVNTFADQAVIAIENTRLITEQREALEQQTATAEVLQVINASPGNLTPVFDAMLEKAMRLCGAAYGVLRSFDGTHLGILASRGVPLEYAEFLARNADPLLPVNKPVAGTGLTQALQTGQPAETLDVRESIGYKSGSARSLAIADLGGARTILHVPLVKDLATVGLFTMYRREVRGFSNKQIALLKNFAAQAVIAMENARLLTEQREALERQTAMAEVLQVINASPGNLTPVFDAVLERALRLCAASFGTLLAYDGEHIETLALLGVPPAFAEWSRRNPLTKESAGLISRGIETGKPVQVTDVTTHAFMTRRDALVELGGIRAILQVPLVKDGTIIGFIAIFRREPGVFPETQVALLEGFAAQAVVAMENARLITEQREALEQQTATTEVLQVINASPGNLEPVFDAMLDKALDLCGAAFGNLWTYDGEMFHAAAVRRVPVPYAYALQRISALGTRSGAVLGQIAAGSAWTQIPDAAAEEAYLDSDARAVIELGQARTIAGVALRKDAALLGAITIYRQEVRLFSDKQIALLQNFGAQAVIAMENARLLTEQREALEQQTATAEVLQVINSSPGNLVPVFDAVLDKALGLCDAAFGVLWTHDGECGHAVALRGVPLAFAEYLTRAPHPIEPGGVHYRLMGGEPIVHIADAGEDQAYRSGNRLRGALVELGGARTVLAVPLRKDKAYLGHFVIYRREVRPFADKQITLVQNFAAQAVIAMENARLLTEQREALEQQTATAEVLQVINSSPGNLAPVFDAILEKAHSLCSAAKGTFVVVDGDQLRLAASRGLSEAFVGVLQRPRGYERGSPPEQLLNGATIIHLIGPAILGGSMGRVAVELEGIRTVLFVPLRRHGVLLGYITAYRQEEAPFSEEQIALLQGFAAQAVIAMENARLLTEQREALEQQTATSEVLQVINTNPGNLTPVFDAMLEKAMRLCGGAFGVLGITSDGETVQTACQGPPALLEFLRDRPPGRPAPGSTMRRLLDGEASAQELDLMASDLYERGDPTRRALVNLGGCRSLASVALRKDDAVLGAIHIYRQEVRPFSDKEVALLQNFAAQAVIAIENARLLGELRQRQEELRITFENMGDGVALFDETRHLVASNRRFQHMLDVPDDVIASRPTFSDYIRYLADHGEYGPDPVDHVQQLLALGSQRRTFERTRPNGRIIEIRVNPVPGGGFVVIYSDITDRKRNEEELRAARDAAEEASQRIETAYRDLKAAQASLIQAEKMASLGQLTAGIAHEIKNPLNFVNNFAELSGDLLGELNDAVASNRQAEIDELTATLQGNLAKITEHGKRADGIVKAMLEHSRGSSGERRMVDLNALIDEALNLAYHGARAQDQSFNMTLERDFAEAIAPIELAPQDMTRVFLNLFSNGFYAATRRARSGADAGFEPTLKVTTRDRGEAVEIRLRDNGIGIPAEIRDKLFQPFFTTKPTGEGTGLGLSISYDIVTQQHGGCITVDSEVGEYSEFIIRLPRTPAL